VESTRATTPRTYDGDGSAAGIGADYYRTEVGEWENSDSPYGTFDQGGNLMEWNETFVVGESRGLRGGFFDSHPPGGDLHASYRGHVTNPIHKAYFIGFRVASVPEPGSITLLCMGAVALLAYGWRRRQRTV